MDDDAYAAALLSILANPDPGGIDPADPYGLAGDGIDRYDGFGRDVRVTSVDVVQGDHGAELDVGFVLALPDQEALQGLEGLEGLEGMARGGSVRLPVDQEWRELSGYAEPGAYAPAVARQVEWAAHAALRRHRSRLRDSPPTVSASPGTHWPALLEELAGFGTVAQVGPARIEIRTPASSTTLLVTPDEWEHVVTVHAGSEIDLYLAELLTGREEDERFVVFFDGDLALSVREKLPPVRSQAPARRLARGQAERPGATYGWFAHRPSGRGSPQRDAER